VLKQLGIPMSTAVIMYLMQIGLTGGIPFPISLPKAPASINMDAMTADELSSALQAGYDDMQAGKVNDASAAFAAFRESCK
jgi:DNA-damage-inducible protein J